MERIFPIKSKTIMTRQEDTFYNPNNPRTTSYGLETLRVDGPKIWNLVPLTIKEMCSLNQFKMTIKCWSPVIYPCRMCKTYIPNLGFIN